MRILILDDLRERHDLFDLMFEAPDAQLCHVYNHAAALIALCNQSTFDAVYLDFNLGADCTGLDTAKFIVETLPRHKWPVEVVVHSADAYGAPKMLKVLQAGGIRARLEEFGSKALGA
jgi:CheY-like chemotaxis protein